MKRQIFLHATALSLVVISCQKAVMPNEDTIVSKANSNGKNAENNVPFMGDYVTTARFPEGTPLHQIITGRGQATHMGESLFVAEAWLTPNAPPPAPVPFTGLATFTAANGDQFLTQFTGVSTPTGPGTSRGDITHTIIGGTGRFEHATGSLTGVAHVTVGNPTNTVNYEGWINY
jgi:hypothetical protein